MPSEPFNAHIIETGTDSYRLRSTRQRQTGGAKSNEHRGPIRLDIPIQESNEPSRYDQFTLLLLPRASRPTISAQVK